MEKKKLTMLILGSMISAANGEDFINAGKELNNFSSQYDFGTPVQSENGAEETPETILSEEGNTTPPQEPAAADKPKKTELRKEFNITCGAKCGISFKADDNDS